MPRQKDLAKKTFSRVDKLNMNNDCIAHRLLNDPSASWGTFTKQFREVLLQPGVNEETIIIQFDKLLDEAKVNLKKYRPRKGEPADLAEIRKLLTGK